MNANTAYKILMDKIPNRKVVSCYEYTSVFVFNTWPKGFKPKDRQDEPLDGLLSVEKTTGAVRVFKPFDISLDEYNSGREIKNFV